MHSIFVICVFTLLSFCFPVIFITSRFIVEVEEVEVVDGGCGGGDAEWFCHGCQEYSVERKITFVF